MPSTGAYYYSLIKYNGIFEPGFSVGNVTRNEVAFPFSQQPPVGTVTIATCGPGPFVECWVLCVVVPCSVSIWRASSDKPIAIENLPGTCRTRAERLSFRHLYFDPVDQLGLSR